MGVYTNISSKLSEHNVGQDQHSAKTCVGIIKANASCSEVKLSGRRVNSLDVNVYIIFNT